MVSAQPIVEKDRGRWIILPDTRVHLVEPVAADLWRGEDQTGAAVTVVVAEGGEARDARTHGREGVELIAVYDGTPGRALAQLLAEDNPVAPALALELARGLVSALGDLHAAGIVHGDLRPARVLIGPPPPTRLVGAGLTGRSDPAYQAPEVALGETVGVPADVYAAGAIVYHLYTGGPPFAGKTAAEIISAQLVREPRPFAEVAPETPAPIAQVVMRCLAKRVDDRATLDELAEALAVERPASSTRRFAGAPALDAFAPSLGLGLAPAASVALDSTVPLLPVVSTLDPGPRPRPMAEPPTPSLVPHDRRPVLAFGIGAALALGFVVWFIVRPAHGPSTKTLPITMASGGGERDALEGRVDRARQRGDLATARTEAEGYARAHPDDAAAFAVLGHVLFAQGEKDRALAAYREAVRMDHGFGAAPELLANLRATFADPQRGDAAFRLAEEIGVPAEPVLQDFAATTPSTGLKRRALDTLAHVSAHKGDSR